VGVPQKAEALLLAHQLVNLLRKVPVLLQVEFQNLRQGVLASPHPSLRVQVPVLVPLLVKVPLLLLLLQLQQALVNRLPNQRV